MFVLARPLECRIVQANAPSQFRASRNQNNNLAHTAQRLYGRASMSLRRQAASSNLDDSRVQRDIVPLDRSAAGCRHRKRAFHNSAFTFEFRAAVVFRGGGYEFQLDGQT